MWLVVKSFDLVRVRLSLSVALDLFGKESQVVHVILLLKLTRTTTGRRVCCDDILLSSCLGSSLIVNRRFTAAKIDSGF